MSRDNDAQCAATALEVVATFGDSFVCIEQCGPPTRHGVRTAILLGVAVACLAVSAFAFREGIVNAERNRDAHAHLVDVLKRPAYSVRAHRLAASYDVLAFGGLLGSFVTFAAALASRERRPGGVRVGDALVTPTSRGYTFAAPGHDTIDPIPRHAKLRVELGAVTVFVSAVSGANEHTVGASRSGDGRMFVFTAGSIAAHAGLWFLVSAAPLEASPPDIDLAEQVVVSVAPSEEEPDPPSQEEHIDDTEGAAGTTTYSLELTTLASAPVMARLARVSAPRVARDRADAIEAARTAGILGSFSSTAFAMLDGVDLSGFDDSIIYGALIDNDAREMTGSFGFGRSGFGGCGYGHDGWGTIGTGRYGTINGYGAGSGYGVGGGVGGSRGRAAAVPTVSLAAPIVTGDHYKVYVRRYIRRHLTKLQYCYEKRLLATPGLAGTVTAQFVIQPTGRVGVSTASGMDEEVSHCVVDVVSAIEFPKTDGGAVQVTYPLVFRRQ